MRISSPATPCTCSLRAPCLAVRRKPEFVLRISGFRAGVVGCRQVSVSLASEFGPEKYAEYSAVRAPKPNPLGSKLGLKQRECLTHTHTASTDFGLGFRGAFDMEALGSM